MVTCLLCGCNATASEQLFVADGTEYSSGQVSWAAAWVATRSPQPVSGQPTLTLIPATRTQEYVLFSWRLLLVDLVVMVYLLCVFAYLLLVGIDVTPVVVTNAFLK